MSKRDKPEKLHFISNHMCCVVHRELYRVECLSRQALWPSENGNLNILVVGSPVRIQMLLWYLINLLKSCVCLYFVRKKPEMLILEILKLPNPGIFEIIVIWHENQPKFLYSNR